MTWTAPTSWTDRRRAFRALLEGAACVHPASVFDPVSARIAEDLGFEAGMFAGSVASLAVLGAPDLVVLTLTEFAEQIRRMTRAPTGCRCWWTPTMATATRSASCARWRSWRSPAWRR